MTSPLSGITVLDLTRNLAGPYATMILGDLGARVIKVERPGVGDDTRQWTPPRWEDHSALFLAINRNKESLEADITSPEGADVIRRLAATADVVVESNRTGSLAKHGLGFDDLSAINPRLVYCSISGFGSVGPDRDRPGYDTIVQAASGVMSINGEPDRPPSRVGPSIIDQGTGMWAALGVLAALRQRDLTGEAQLIETSLMESGVAWMGYFASNYIASGVVPQPQGSRHAQMAPYEGFMTQDGFLFIAALNDSLFARLCAVLNLNDLVHDPRYVDNAARVAHRDELSGTIGAVMLQRSAGEWEKVLRAAGLPCSRVNTVDQVISDPQVEALGMVRSWPHPDIEDFRLIDHPLSYNGTRSFRQDAPPSLGQHTAAILAEAGYDEEAISAMVSSHRPPVPVTSAGEDFPA
ncbi:CoA transferase [Aeromicrobium fastidiosum]|uniref:CaiB/BaiF CoA transferase family protein n=1 Tax=Aeromicrobium TaxID=2040 RepID=UPI00177E5B87|nr:MULTISPECIES: CoA transferase [Aeromicrobium]MBD8605484.1 CoA transferase [Aeromicrobium sp. CFBP 8757]MCL8250401.1 CoA transferase [Aeromicrobium fastidiosum]